MLLEKCPAEPAADVEARGVAEHRAGPDDRDQRDQLDLALAGDHPTRHHDRLARRDESHERPRFEEGGHTDEGVGPRAERIGDVLDDLLRVRQRRQDPTGIDRQGEHGEDAERLALEAQPPPAPDDVRRDSTATTAATISRADMATEGTSAKLRDERAGQLLGGPLGSGAIGEQAEQVGPSRSRRRRGRRRP